MATNYTSELYTKAVQYKQELEDYINELYVSYNNFTFEDKLVVISVIDDLKEVVLEYEKYIIAYQNSNNKTKTKNDYVVVQGDTLLGISYKTTGSIENWKKIYEFNNLTDIMLSPGTILEIPEDTE